MELSERARHSVRLSVKEVFGAAYGDPEVHNWKAEAEDLLGTIAKDMDRSSATNIASWIKVLTGQLLSGAPQTEDTVAALQNLVECVYCAIGGQESAMGKSLTEGLSEDNYKFLVESTRKR